MRAAIPLILCALSWGLASAVQAQNIVVVVLDDVGVDRVGAYGYATSGPTPNIDSLAQQGVLFRRFWAHPMCSPFRASALTGTHPERHGVGTSIIISGTDPDRFYGLDASTPNIASVLRANGYRTAALGKWHLAGADQTPMHPLQAGFDYHAGSMGNPSHSMTGLGATGYFNWEKCVNGTCALSTTYMTTDTTDEAIAQLSGSEPFFLWVAYNAAHAPLHDPPWDLHSFDGQCSSSPLPKATCHKAMIEAMDTEIGRLLAAVDLADTTVFIVGDNGTPAAWSEPPFPSGHGKGTVYEGGVNVPFIVAGEAVDVLAEGQESIAIVQSADLFATVMSIAGAHASAMDSVSLLAFLIDPAFPSARGWALSEAFEPNGGPPDPLRLLNRTARNGRYKLIRFGVDPSADEFYDLVVDPFEQSPLDLGSLTPSERAALDTLAEVIELPEPSQLSMLATGIAFLLLLGRSRIRP